MASSSSVSRSEYDVFLSFRGEDTRKTFVGHLYTALDQRGIRTFKDDERLERGKSISLDLVKNINESSIAVIVFSKNYASSPWCLDELVEILECRRSKGQIVLPIFYHVKASEVRKQKGSFAEAFRNHEQIHTEEMERVQRWRAALKEAANLSGLDLQDAANGYEDTFIRKIVQVILRKLHPKPFRVAEYEVSIYPRANKVIKLLNVKSSDKLFVGIVGIGGIGKTTVAKAVFNQISNGFERNCFLENVREESTKQHGLAKLQQKFLRETLMDKSLKISNCDRGINEIKDRLKHKKILLVLDDVNQEKQLTSLAGIGHDWFGSGSKIIITTRDERLLIKYNIVKTYKVELLDDEEALELFSWHAFKQNNPVEKYRELSRCVKDYAKGLPLALQVLGSFLCERSIFEWVSELDKLKSNPPKKIQDVLKISYDSLDKKEKAIFLDIACFFKGYEEKFAMDFFESCEFQPVIGIKVLIERSLITISEYNELQMHDLIQEMGREIVRQESEDPGKRSRLWSTEDINKVFTENMVTENIEAIMVTEEGLTVSVDAFTKMRKLRILKISGMQLHGSLTYLSNELRYLDWNGYPEKYLPYNFHPKKLVQLHLRNSLIEGIWMDTKILNMVKVLDLRFCKYLPARNPNFSGFPFLEILIMMGCASLVEVEFDDMKVLDKLQVLDLRFCRKLKKTPNLSGLPCLEYLGLEGCTSLVEVHSSIKFHERLVQLNLNKCKNLKILATRINLKSLRVLWLNDCSKLEKFPEIEEDMECLEYLWSGRTAIKELPPSIGHLKRLKRLDLRDCSKLEKFPEIEEDMECLECLLVGGTAIKELPPSIGHLKWLKSLGLRSCSKLEKFPEIEEDMECLENLWLGGTAIKELPPSIGHLKRLKCLGLRGCSKLEKFEIKEDMKCLEFLLLDRTAIKELSPSIGHLKRLKFLSLRGCKIIESLSIAQLTQLVELEWSYCNLDEESILNLPHSLWKLNLSGNDFVSLPASFSQLTNLYHLALVDCSRLQTLESLPSSTRSLDLRGCSSLRALSLPSFTSEVLAQGCVSLQGYSIQTSDGCIFTEIHKSVENHGNKQPNIYYSEVDVFQGISEHVAPESEIPSWFSYIKVESDCEDMSWVCLWMDANSFRYLRGVSVCAIFGSNQDHIPPDDDEEPFNDDEEESSGNDEKNGNYIDLIINDNLIDNYLVDDRINRIESDHIMLFHEPNIGWVRNSDECYIEASINGSYSSGRPLKVKKWGLHPIMDAQYENDNEDDDDDGSYNNEDDDDENGNEDVDDDGSDNNEDDDDDDKNEDDDDDDDNNNEDEDDEEVSLCGVLNIFSRMKRRSR